MTIDLEGDLRGEFNAAIAPNSLTFHPESVMRDGSRTVRRRRLVAGGSTAVVLALVAAGVGLLNRPEDSVAPQPATPTATIAATATVRAELDGPPSGNFQLELNRDALVASNVRLFMVKEDGHRREVAAWSTGKPGQKPDASWKSGMVDGNPFTVGLVPGTLEEVRLATGAFYSTMPAVLTGTGYTGFSVVYPDPNDPSEQYPHTKADEAAARPAKIASISWSGPTGIVDGIEGGHRLTGQILTLDKFESVKVMLRPGKSGSTTVFGSAHVESDGTGMTTALGVATVDPSGVAVVTGRQPILLRTFRAGQDMSELTGGPPIAAGVLPVGASEIGVILTTGEDASGLPLSQRLPDGRVIFAIKAEGSQPSNLSKDSIKAVTWTNADGSHGRKDVTHKKS